MPTKPTGFLSRGVYRLQRLSNRARLRLRGQSIRVRLRGQIPPIPPARLLHLVAGTEDVDWFLRSGALGANCLREILARNGLPIESFGSILDFGCGSGRVMRHWHDLRGPKLHGSDYNPTLIRWCRANLPFARFGVNGLETGIDGNDASFDLIYTLSVFTHLSQPRQHFWINELSRLLKPVGYLFLTVHGAHYLDRLSPEEQRQFQNGQLVVQKASREGSNDCAVFHPEAYVRATLARGFEVVDFIPEGALGNPRQDVYLLRKAL